MTLKDKVKGKNHKNVEILCLQIASLLSSKGSNTYIPRNHKIKQFNVYNLYSEN
jgi:hypothetical protein